MSPLSLGEEGPVRSAVFAGDLFWEGGGSSDVVVGTAGMVGGGVGAAEESFWFSCRFGGCHNPDNVVTG